MPDPTVITITPTLDTGIYADNEVLFAPVELPDVFACRGGCALLQSVGVADASDQGAAFDLIFFTSSVTLGSLNGSPSISDADTAKARGRVQISSGDYYDLGGARFADIAGPSCARLFKALDGQNMSLWVGGISRGTGTYAATALTINFGFIR